ncbi:MAG: Rieske (2Fe-2S) protein [Alphaproteobacteria bacterium]|nr:Rieske (2Fe-2S) protein [Alphaproteobacteria bacterium]MCB9795792.1 Rieske (2Fe-2S) protein [Alphaproteobacteria bacterium]
MTPTWIPAVRLDALPEGRPKLFSLGRHKLVLVKHDGAVYAVDNACPHEGYPLVQGQLQGCLLTCSWHNYKFDVRDGACVKGEEDVRSYPTRVMDGVVQVDLTEPDPAAEAPKARASLATALFERRMGQVCRDLARLLHAGVEAPRILGELAAYDGRHAEWGATHALAVAADMLPLLASHPGGEAVLLLAQPAELIAFDQVRRPPREVPEPEAPPADPERAFERLRERVEAEDVAGAEALVRGAVEGGWGRDVLEPWFLRLCSDHFLSFGHPLIYSTKAFDLLDQAGWDLAPEVLGGLIGRVVNATREDLLPAWRAWSRRVAELTPHLEALYNRQVRGGPAWWDREGLIGVLLDGKPAAALDALLRRVEEGVALTDLVGALSAAAAERVLRFDPAVDQRPDVQEGWLDVTHVLTFTHAVREALARAPHPELLRLLLQSARFINHAKVLDLPPERRPRPTAGARGEPAAALEAVTRGAAEEAMGEALAALQGGRGAALEARLLAHALRGAATLPIFCAHEVKTLIAAFAETRELEGEPGAERPALAAVRFMAGPVRERSLESLVVDARGFVEEGRVPERLT